MRLKWLLTVLALIGLELAESLNPSHRVCWLSHAKYSTMCAFVISLRRGKSFSDEYSMKLSRLDSFDSIVLG